MRYIPDHNLPLTLDTPQYGSLLALAAAIGVQHPHTQLFDDGSRITRYAEQLPVYVPVCNIEFQPF